MEMETDGNGLWFSGLCDFESDMSRESDETCPIRCKGTSFFLWAFQYPPPGTKLAKSKPAESA